MSQEKPQQNAAGLLLELLEEERQQTKLIRPISILARITLVILIVAVLLGVIGIAFQIAVSAALR